MFHDDPAEDFARVDIFQPDIGVDGGLHVAAAKKSSDELVLARPGLENESACRVPELMHRHTQPGRPVTPLRALTAEHGVGFGAACFPLKHTVIRTPTWQFGPQVVDVLDD